jgi:alkylmercury lyase
LTEDFDAGWRDAIRQYLPAAEVLSALYRLTGAGQRPVELARLAAVLERTPGEALSLAQQWAPVRVNDGSLDLDLTSASPSGRYRLGAGGRTIEVDGCAPDVFFVPIFAGLPVHVESVCPTTGAAIEVDLAPEGATRVAPSSTVVAVVDPRAPELRDVTSGEEFNAGVCTQQPFFASPAAAAGWLAKHPGGRVLTVGEFHDWWRRALSLVTDGSTIRELADAIAAAALKVDEAGRRIVVALYELLALGDPVSPASLAARAGLPETVVPAALDGWPGVFRDGDGNVVGFVGLAIPEMAHRIQFDAGKPIHAWCALDPFLVVPVIGRAARVESTDPVTGDRVTMAVTPDGIKDLSPATAMVSFVAPTGPFDQDAIQSFCNFVHNFQLAGVSRALGGRAGGNRAARGSRRLRGRP